MKTLVSLLILGCVIASSSALAAVSDAETSLICDAPTAFAKTFDRAARDYYIGFGVGVDAAGVKDANPLMPEIKKLDPIAGDLAKNCKAVGQTRANGKQLIDTMRERCGSLCTSLIPEFKKRLGCNQGCERASEIQMDRLAVSEAGRKELAACKSNLVATQAILEGYTNSNTTLSSKKMGEALPSNSGKRTGESKGTGSAVTPGGQTKFNNIE